MVAQLSMVENSRLPARSNNGCWTCRLRRKKCDEARPFCSPCISLDLECHGYGPRPDWMDNGILQRTQAAIFKRLVSQGTSKKGRRHQLHTSHNSLASSGGMRSFASSRLDATIDPSLITFRQISGPNPRDEPQQQGQQKPGYGLMSMADHVFSMEAASPTSFVHQFGTDLQDGFGSQDNAWDQNLNKFTDPTFLEPASTNTGSRHLGTSTNLDQIRRLEPDRCTNLEWPISGDVSMDTCFDHEYYGGTLVPSHIQQSSQPSTTIGPIKPSLISNSVSPVPSKIVSTKEDLWACKDMMEMSHAAPNVSQCDNVDSPSQQSTLGGNTEDTLFMHYLDQVFYIQFPFCRFHHRQGRGWILAILRRTKSAYHAALALSERHLLPLLLHEDDLANDSYQLHTQSSHYDLAVQKLQSMVLESHASNGPAAVKPSLEVLMTLLQLFFFEIFNGGREKWHGHLRTASRFIPLLLRERTAKAPSSSPGSDSSCERLERRPFCPEVDSALKFLVGSFIIFDIIASASTRSAPFLPIDHVRTIEELEISLEPLVGFQNSVMALLLEVVTLDKWKEDAQSVNKLSIIDLAKRGDGIQERLRQELATTEKALSEQSSCDFLGSTKGSPSHPLIGKIFILAVTTYLHVVLSGPYPAVPEIAKSVGETIAAIKSLQDRSLLRYLVWPLCISGCLALEQHYDFFRDLMAREKKIPLSTGTYSEAFSIMQECWRARVSSDASCDWAAMMKRRGCYVYLG